MDPSLRPLCASGEAAPCGKGRSGGANEGGFGATSAGFVFQSLSRREGARRARRDFLTNRALQDHGLSAGWLGLCAPSVPAAKPRLVARERSGGANEGGFGAASAGFVFQSLSRREGARRAQRRLRFHVDRKGTWAGAVNRDFQDNDDFRPYASIGGDRLDAPEKRRLHADGRGVSMRMEGVSPCGWKSRPHAGGTAPGVLGHWAAFTVYYPP